MKLYLVVLHGILQGECLDELFWTDKAQSVLQAGSMTTVRTQITAGRVSVFIQTASGYSDLNFKVSLKESQNLFFMFCSSDFISYLKLEKF